MEVLIGCRFVAYDINDDNVKESTKILNDRDMDGNFEEEFVYDGTVFDNSVIFD